MEQRYKHFDKNHGLKHPRFNFPHSGGKFSSCKRWIKVKVIVKVNLLSYDFQSINGISCKTRSRLIPKCQKNVRIWEMKSLKK